jgi:hypothetical protein
MQALATDTEIKGLFDSIQRHLERGGAAIPNTFKMKRPGEEMLRSWVNLNEQVRSEKRAKTQCIGITVHYVSDLREVRGIVFPTKRRFFPRQLDGHSTAETRVVSIDSDQFVLSQGSRKLDTLSKV